MYQFVSGPLVWLAFIIFTVGIIARAVWYFKGLDWQMDRVAYKPHLRFGVKGALRSIFFWLMPYGTRSWRQNPFFTLLVFILHIGLLITPIFLMGHNIMLEENFGFSLPTISATTADVLTVLVIIAVMLLALRRIALPEVRIMTNRHDYAVLLIAVTPFITGLLARYQVANYDFWLIAHILAGEIFLVTIPLTKLSHFILFFLSRMQLGMDYGIKRGGMKSKGMAW